MPTVSPWSSSTPPCGCAKQGIAQRIALLEGCFEPRELPVIVEHGLTTVVHSFGAARMLDALPPEALSTCC